MNKQQVIDKLHSHLSDKGTIYPKWELTEFVESFLEVVSESLRQGNNISLTKFGKFSVKTKKTRKFYNIQKGAIEQAPPKRVVEFAPHPSIVTQQE